MGAQKEPLTPVTVMLASSDCAPEDTADNRYQRSIDGRTPGAMGTQRRGRQERAAHGRGARNAIVSCWRGSAGGAGGARSKFARARQPSGWNGSSKWQLRSGAPTNSPSPTNVTCAARRCCSRCDLREPGRWEFCRKWVVARVGRQHVGEEGAAQGGATHRDGGRRSRDEGERRDGEDSNAEHLGVVVGRS